MSGKGFLWATPRSHSSAFTRAMINLSDCEVFLEPYLDAFYNGPNRTSQRYANEPVDPDATFTNATAEICKKYDGKNHVFCKEMAYYFEGRLNLLAEQELREFKHAFLIRDPHESIASLYKVCETTSDPYWAKSFDANECGYRQLYETYNFVKNELGATPLVISSRDLLAKPEAVLKAFCDYNGFNYKEGMSKWEPVPIKKWERYGDFTNMVVESSGIRHVSKKAIDPTTYPEYIQTAMVDSMWYYEQLHDKRLVINNS